MIFHYLPVSIVSDEKADITNAIVYYMCNMTYFSEHFTDFL